MGRQSWSLRHPLALDSHQNRLRACYSEFSAVQNKLFLALENEFSHLGFLPPHGRPIALLPNQAEIRRLCVKAPSCGSPLSTAPKSISHAVTMCGPIQGTLLLTEASLVYAFMA
eukprot:IDg11009t1